MTNERATALSELARAALLGVEREAVPIPTADSPLLPFWSQLSDVAPEYQLLSMAGVGKLYQQAGTFPPRMANPAGNGDEPDYRLAVDFQSVASDGDSLAGKDGPTVENAADSLETVCSVVAGQVLVALMDAAHKTLLPEYLRMMAAAHLTVPAEYLPNVLSYGVNQSSLRGIIEQIIGDGGRRLAAQNPRWLYASPVQMSWDAALQRFRRIRTSTARQLFLRQLRGQDPALGLRILQSVWKSVKPSDRVSLMRALEVRLSMSDEPFLEAALDDRNNSVRKKAVDLLTTMPESRLCKRMTRNTESLLEWVPAVGEDSDKEEDSDEKSEKKATILVHFPAEPSPEMQRDGVLKRTIKDDSRRRRMELLDMITAVPLQVWCERWQVTPTEIVQAVRSSRWPRTLTQALVQATERQRDLVWVEALLEESEFKLPVTKLIGMLPPAEFDRLVDRNDPGVAAENPLNKSHPLVTAVRRWSPEWSEPLSKRWLMRMEEQVPLDAETSSLDSLVRTATKQFARCCAQPLVDEAIIRLEAMAKGCPEAWAPTIEQSLVTLKMRRRMRDVLSAAS